MKRRVLLTGATGVMGSVGLDELLARGFDVTVLVRDTKSNRAKMAKYGDAIRVVWGLIPVVSRTALARAGPMP